MSIEEEFKKADAVLVVEINGEETLTAHGLDCGVRYTGSVRATFKHSMIRGNDVTFGRYTGLAPRKRYLLFLSYIADPVAHYETLRIEHDLPTEPPEEKKITIERIKCQGTIPGLVYAAQAAWEVKLNYVVVSGIRPVMPDHIGISSVGPLEWLVNKEDLFSYLRSLAAKPG